MAAFEAILWDIDGTLLRGGGVGREATRMALEAVFGTSAGLDGHRFGGKTDWFSVRELMGAAGFPSAEIDARIPDYAVALSREMVRLIGGYRVERLPRAREIVSALHAQGGVYQGIVTGNVYANVAVKLEAGGFDPAWFPFGAYGDESANRDDLPPLALERLAALAGRVVSPGRVLVVGDTVRDIEAARAVGARVCIVKTGYADANDLAAAKPDWLLPDLTTFDAVLAG